MAVAVAWEAEPLEQRSQAEPGNEKTNEKLERTPIAGAEPTLQQQLVTYY